MIHNSRRLSSLLPCSHNPEITQKGNQVDAGLFGEQRETRHQPEPVKMHWFFAEKILCPKVRSREAETQRRRLQHNGLLEQQQRRQQHEQESAESCGPIVEDLAYQQEPEADASQRENENAQASRYNGRSQQEERESFEEIKERWPMNHSAQRGILGVVTIGVLHRMTDREFPSYIGVEQARGGVLTFIHVIAEFADGDSMRDHDCGKREQSYQKQGRAIDPLASRGRGSLHFRHERLDRHWVGRKLYRHLAVRKA